MHFSATAILLLQLLVILSIVKLFGFLFKKIGQPAVIGEIIAGIVLGPSLLGAIFPQSYAFLFPKESLGVLQQLSQVGLMLFMFIIGMEFNTDKMKDMAKESAVVSISSIVLPFVLGAIFAYYIYDEALCNHHTRISFILFVGISMSVTAFPVLIRILEERSMTQSSIGVFVTGVAALVDVIAWILLAAITTIVQGQSLINSIYQVTLLLLLFIAAIYLVKPFLDKQLRENTFITRSTFSLIIICLLLFALATEVIGIHALFGSFLAGIIIPDKEKFREKLIAKIEMPATVLFLPLFFVVTGLRTKINLLQDPALIGQFLFILAIAFSGKLLGSALPAKLFSRSWKESWTIGVLMNTRGLMELVVLNLGYDLGILPQNLFTMLTLMAIISTVLTSPLLDLINRFQEK
jgi:Kef-type K+ transport system membrane component KefB